MSFDRRLHRHLHLNNASTTIRVALSSTILALLVIGCADNFEPANKVSAVRILGTQADLPFARPGETVTLTTLAGNFRQGATNVAPVRYFPVPCVNPRGDEAANCYPELASPFIAGVDITDTLVTTEQFTFQVPADAITSHTPPRSGPAYGVAYVFLAACTGHIQLVGIDPKFPGAPPFACFDDQNVRLGSDQFVFAFARIYVFEELRNANPVLLGATFAGATIDPAIGITVDRCTTIDQDDCPAHDIDAAVSPPEDDPAASISGFPSTEQLWVSYFVSGGEMLSNVSILYDARAGKLTNTANEYRAPLESGDYGLWVVARDNRGGVSWANFPIHVP